jgi:hypothetical protein
MTENKILHLLIIRLKKLNLIIVVKDNDFEADIQDCIMIS